MPLSYMAFRLLDDEDTDKMKKWAKENYEPFSSINGTWHPICQAACVQINHEHSTYKIEARELEDEHTD